MYVDDAQYIKALNSIVFVSADTSADTGHEIKVHAYYGQIAEGMVADRSHNHE